VDVHWGRQSNRSLEKTISSWGFTNSGVKLEKKKERGGEREPHGVAPRRTNKVGGSKIKRPSDLGGR